MNAIKTNIIKNFVRPLGVKKKRDSLSDKITNAAPKTNEKDMFPRSNIASVAREKRKSRRICLFLPRLIISGLIVFFNMKTKLGD